jgi:hypothetical protein
LKQFGAYTGDIVLSETQRTLKRIAGEIPFAVGAALIATTAYMLTPENTPAREAIPVAGVCLGVGSYLAYQGYRAYQKSRR